MDNAAAPLSETKREHIHVSMSLRFVHTADWQLGKPFGAFPDDRAALLREARLDVIERIGAVARSHDGLVLVAGDVFDTKTAEPALVAKALARMQRHDKVRWHLISGNHDPVRVAGPWRLMMQLGLPDNVVLHLRPDVQEIAPGVSLLPAPLAMSSTSLDPTSWMDGAEIPAGHFRIGIAHGSVRGFSSEGEPTIPIAIDRARRAGLDYLALGDWHGAVGIDERTWY
ncbi:MAG: metallophosphoesterase, partial [Hyphomicrobiales bacterium]|nr:metallophosphoesterase [Hyphomicrobiales bacterium]